MNRCRRHLRSFTWLALFAMIGLALAPTVSHALAGAGGAAGRVDPWAEICSAAAAKPGTVAVVVAHAADEALSSPTAAHANPLDHCPLCGAAGPAAALPPPALAPFHAPDGADFIPALFAQAPRPLFAWAAAQPRGPPAIS